MRPCRKGRPVPVSRPVPGAAGPPRHTRHRRHPRTCHAFQCTDLARRLAIPPPVQPRLRPSAQPPNPAQGGGWSRRRLRHRGRRRRRRLGPGPGRPHGGRARGPRPHAVLQAGHVVDRLAATRQRAAARRLRHLAPLPGALPAARRRRELLDLRHEVRRPQPHRVALFCPAMSGAEP